MTFLIDQLQQLLIGPIIGLLNGISKILSTEMIIQMFLYFTSTRMLNLFFTGFKNIQIFTSHQNIFSIPLKKRRNLLISQ